MFDIRNILPGKHRQLSGLLLLLIICAICAAFTLGGNDDFDIAKREVFLRKIGHELLLQAGDSTSRVLPVRKIANDEYEVGFENEFSFEPESLVSVTRRLLPEDALATDYVVNVMKCGSPAVIYAYAISANKAKDHVPCLGRTQPKACYKINIKFRPAGINNPNKYLLGSLPLLAIIGFVLFRRKPAKASSGSQHNENLSLGNMLFDVKNSELVTVDKTISLTGTESRLLLILAQSPNEITERSRLQKEIWEDEGVIVGRSLDMFISKLRKKLECDPNISITVVRGKGYKLEISS